MSLIAWIMYLYKKLFHDFISLQEEPEYHGDSSSATATPEPVSKRQGKPSNSDQYAKVIKSEAPIVDQVTEEKEEELVTKKVKKIPIEEVEVNIKITEFSKVKIIVDYDWKTIRLILNYIWLFSDARNIKRGDPDDRIGRATDLSTRKSIRYE